MRGLNSHRKKRCNAPNAGSKLARKTTLTAPMKITEPSMRCRVGSSRSGSARLSFQSPTSSAYMAHSIGNSTAMISNNRSSAARFVGQTGFQMPLGLSLTLIQIRQRPFQNELHCAGAEKKFSADLRRANPLHRSVRRRKLFADEPREQAPAKLMIGWRQRAMIPGSKA